VCSSDLFCLLLDNAICHTHIELSNVQPAWFLPNTTNVSPPVDQGIIRNYKLLMQSLLTDIDPTSSTSELARTVSVLDVVIWIHQALKKLLPETATKCLKKQDFLWVKLLAVQKMRITSSTCKIA
jgi:hypothetical protein